MVGVWPDFDCLSSEHVKFSRERRLDALLPGSLEVWNRLSYVALSFQALSGCVRIAEGSLSNKPNPVGGHSLVVSRPLVAWYLSFIDTAVCRALPLAARK